MSRALRVIGPSVVIFLLAGCMSYDPDDQAVQAPTEPVEGLTGHYQRGFSAIDEARDVTQTINARQATARPD